MRTRARRYLSRASLFLLALSVFLAPICSARCSFSNCLPAPTQSTSGCHQHSSPSPKVLSLQPLAATACQPSDSLLTTLPASRARAVQMIHSELFAFELDSLPLAPFATMSPRSISADPSPHQLLSSSGSTPLRI